VVLETDAGPTSVFRSLGKVWPDFSKAWKFRLSTFPTLENIGATVTFFRVTL
jgi:hypothetical protein